VTKPTTALATMHHRRSEMLMPQEIMVKDQATTFQDSIVRTETRLVIVRFAQVVRT
jgi:hypothetical protein